MTVWALLLFTTCVVVELFIRLPLLENANKLMIVVQKSSSTIASKHISDHWKEKVLPAYSQQLFVLSIKLFVILLVAVSPFLLVAIVTDRFTAIEFSALISSGIGILGSTVVAVVYFYLRKILVKP